LAVETYRLLANLDGRFQNELNLPGSVISQQETEQAYSIGTILNELKWRAAQWKSDEPVIFAGLLGLDPKPLLEVSWKKRDCIDRRFELLYARINGFPTNSLYSKVDRMQIPELGWAPRTLRIHDWDDDGVVARYNATFDYSSSRIGTVRPEGLTFWGDDSGAPIGNTPQAQHPLGPLAQYPAVA
jgi:hypothetical protein